MRARRHLHYSISRAQKQAFLKKGARVFYDITKKTAAVFATVKYVSLGVKIKASLPLLCRKRR